MNVSSLTWFDDEDPRDLRRWALAAAVVLGIHAAAIAAYVYTHRPEEIGDDMTPIAVDFSPSTDTVDQPEVAPAPEQPTPQTEQPPPPPPPPPEPQAVVAPETPPPLPKVEQPPQQAQPARIKGGSPQIKEQWLSSVAKRLAQHVAPYPPGALSRGEEGIVHVSFWVDHGGRAHDVRVIKSSGYTDLDDAAVQMVEKDQPFPPLPSTVDETKDSLVDFPLRFERQ